MEEKNRILQIGTSIFGSIKTMMCAGLVLEHMMEFVELQFGDEESELFGKYTPEEFCKILINKAEQSVKGEYRKIIVLGLLHAAMILETENGKVSGIKISGLADAVDLDDEEKLEGYIWCLLSTLVGKVPAFIDKVNRGLPIDTEVHEGDTVSRVLVQKGKGRFRNISFEDACENADILFA